MVELRFERALLVVPPTGLYIREDRCQTPIEELVTVAPRPPIDLLYIAGVLEREGVECRIVDCPVEGKSWQDFQHEMREFGPQAVFLSVTTATLADDLRAATMAKREFPDVLTVAKGPHFQFRDKQTLENHRDLDVAIRGEYEVTASELARAGNLADIPGLTFRGGEEIIRTAERAFQQDLDTLPFPSRHLIDNRLYRRPDTDAPQTTVVTSRGCPFRCVFCLSRVVAGSKPRVRSSENVLAEIRECIERFGIRDFLFRSDTFTARRPWLLELCEALENSGLKIRWACNSRVDTLDKEMLEAMKEAGCWLIAFGLESGSQKMLDIMKKGISKQQIREAMTLCKQVGMKKSVYFLLGLPWETEETFRETVSFAKELSPDFIEFFYTYPFEGTELYETCVAENLVDPNALPVASYSRPSYATKHFTLEELASHRQKALRSFYLRPGYIVKTLWRARSPKVLKNYVHYGFKQLTYLFR